MLCVGLGFHVVSGVGRLTVQFQHAYAIPNTKFFSSGCCSPTLSCHRQLKLYPKFLDISHREKRPFEVLSLHLHDDSVTEQPSLLRVGSAPATCRKRISGDAKNNQTAGTVRE